MHEGLAQKFWQLLDRPAQAVENVGFEGLSSDEDHTTLCDMTHPVE